MDAKTIINLGLAKIGPQRINNLSPPGTSLERHCAPLYPQWRDSELTKRRWAFANKPYALNPNATVSLLQDLPYAFDVPADALRIIRAPYARWRQSGKLIYGHESTLTIEYTRKVDGANFNENDFHPLFVDLLAVRCARECVEHVTTSNVKMQTIAGWYQEVLAEAGTVNALILDTDDAQLPEELDSWELGRLGYGA